jgi:hypothetical protein
LEIAKGFWAHLAEFSTMVTRLGDPLLQISLRELDTAARAFNVRTEAEWQVQWSRGH